jgi:hypothetical protein
MSEVLKVALLDPSGKKISADAETSTNKPSTRRRPRRKEKPLEKVGRERIIPLRA